MRSLCILWRDVDEARAGGRRLAATAAAWLAIEHGGRAGADELVANELLGVRVRLMRVRVKGEG